ncbi:MAG: diguanylate cyclase, partial [Candidatus Dormibacteria bacterium]
MRFRAWYFMGASAVIGAAAWEVARASLPTAVYWAEVVLFAVGITYAALVIAFQRQFETRGSRFQFASMVFNVGLASAILAVAVPYLMEPMPFAFAVMAVTVLAAIISFPEEVGSWSQPLFVTICGVIGLAVVWLRLGVGQPGGPGELVLWDGLLIGFGLLTEVHRRRGRARLEARMAHLETVVREAQRLGDTTDLAAVGAAVLTAFQECFPHLNWGGILLYDSATEALESLPIYLTPQGVVGQSADTGTTVSIHPGEGIVGQAFASGEICFRRNRSEAERDISTRSATSNDQIREKIGAILSAVATPLRLADGRVIGVVSLVSTVSEFKWGVHDQLLVRGITDQAGVAIERGRLFDQQRRNALTDHLTGMPNRREFERILAARPAAETFAVLAIDLDNLKLINDEHGHEAGDTVLRLVGHAIEAGLRSEDFVARVGGDEFAAVLPATDEPAAEEVAARIANSMTGLAVPFGVARISVGCAAGAAGTDPREVWSLADEALYRAKASGRNRVEVLKRRDDNAESR